jgi:hypothetical protein
MDLEREVTAQVKQIKNKHSKTGCLFCDSICHMEKQKENEPLSEEALENINELGDVLRQIHNRLLKEGKVKVVNGKCIFLTEPPTE